MARISKAEAEEKAFKDQVRSEAIKAAKTVVRKSSISPDFTEDDPDLEELDSNFMLEEDDSEPLTASDRFAQLKSSNTSSSSSSEDEEMDIFDRFNKSEDFPVNYTIQRNGELLAKKMAPYSWEELQKEFGGGMYKVIAKNTLNGRMLKHESKSVAHPQVPERKLEERIERERDSVKDIISTVNNQFTESLNAIKESSNKNIEILLEKMKQDKEEQLLKEKLQREEAMELKKIQEQAGQSTNQLLATLLPLLMKKDDGGDSTMKLMMEMQRMNLESQKELQRQMLEMQKDTREEMRRMQEATQNMMSKLVTELKPVDKKPEFDALDIMRMMQDAEAKGMEKMQQFMDLADERAERRIEEMKDDKGDKEEESILKSTMKLLVPALVSQGMSKGASAPAPEQRLIAQHRPAAPARPQAHAIPTNVVTPKQTPVKTQAKPVAKAPQARPVVGNTPVSVKTTQAPKEVAVVDNAPKEATIDPVRAKAVIEQVATPILGKAFQDFLGTQQFDASGTAKETAAALEQQGISVKTAVEVYKLEDMLKLCHGYGINTPETDEFLRVYYENLKACVAP